MEERRLKVDINPKPFWFLKNSDKRINILYGSADSGKSWAIAQHLLVNKMLREKNVRLLMTRATGPALKKSCWLLMDDLRRKYDIDMKINRSDLTMAVNGNTAFFVPLDDVDKLKSFERLNYVWANEATELTYRDYLQLNVRCRGENESGMNQLFFDFNPIDENSFWKDIVDTTPDNVAVEHCTYSDNRFANPEDIKELERLKEQDPVYYSIYALGQWASPQNIIYIQGLNWDIVDEWPEDGWFDEVIYGLDFGFNNPTALAELGIKDQEIWQREILYEKNLTNTDLIERIESLIEDEERPIYADSAEPDRITEIERAGFNIWPSKKGKNSVQNGIDSVKKHKRHVYKESTNAIAEDRGYKWKEDRNGNILDEPVKFRDHFKDAERYAIHTHFAQDDAPDIWGL